MRLALVLAVGLASCRDHRAVEPPPSTGTSVGQHVDPPPPPSNGTSSPTARKLYADGVPTDTLQLSIGIETLGGVSTVVLPRGTRLPAHFSQEFSTGADNQPSVEVHLVQGERPMASDNREIGKLQLRGIPAALRGVPQILVSVTIDNRGVLDVEAVDKATGRRNLVVLDSAGAPLDQAAIAQALADADAHRTDDARSRGITQLKIDLGNLVAAQVQLDRDAGAKLTPELHARWLKTIDNARAALATGDPVKVQTAQAELGKVANTVAAMLYAGAKPLADPSGHAPAH